MPGQSVLQGEEGEVPAGMGHPAEPPGKGVLPGDVAGGKQGPC